MSTLDHVRFIVDSLPHCKKLGLRVTELNQGNGRIELLPRPEFVGNIQRNLMHSSIVTTVLDTLCGTVASSAFEDIQTVATLDLRIDHLQTLNADLPLYGYATCFHRSPDVAYVRGWAWQDDENNHVCEATGTFMVNGPFKLMEEMVEQ